MTTPLRPARAGSLRVAAWQRQYLGDADRRRIMDAARRLERRSHQPGLHGGALRRTGILVLWTLLYRGPSKHGVCDPSISQLAEWSGCARSTVQTALGRIEAAGIMGHIRRGIVVTVRSAARWCQWTNAYLFASVERWHSDTENWSAQVSLTRKKAQEGEGAGKDNALSAAEQQALLVKWGLAMPSSLV
jgi:DNA-binding MarR family transcriptional regulator